MLVSINPGGPNGGSATQYFIGDFDGEKFTLDEEFAAQLRQTTTTIGLILGETTMLALLGKTKP